MGRYLHVHWLYGLYGSVRTSFHRLYLHSLSMGWPISVRSRSTEYLPMLVCGITLLRCYFLLVRSTLSLVVVFPYPVFPPGLSIFPTAVGLAWGPTRRVLRPGEPEAKRHRSDVSGAWRALEKASQLDWPWLGAESDFYITKNYESEVDFKCLN